MTDVESATRRAPVDRIERWSLDRIKPYPNNPRVHTPEQVEQIAASMREFDQTQAVLVDEEGVLIAGHGRLLAAQELGWSEIMVAIAQGWTEPQKRAYRIADNQLTLASRWDDVMLREEYLQLKLDGVNLKLLAFEDEQLRDLDREANQDGIRRLTSEHLSGLNYAVIIRCTDERQQIDILNRLKQEGLHVEALIS